MIDATIVRAHQHAAGARGGQEKEELGRSRGGLSTKIHIVVDALGYPIDYRLTPGQAHEITQAVNLLSGKRSEYVIADKGYDSDEFRAMLKVKKIEAVIPPKSNRIEQPEYDKHIYKERNVIERLFCKLKQFRRIATRYDKTAVMYAGMLALACIWVWLQ